jgi:hypothetical protein
MPLHDPSSLILFGSLGLYYRSRGELCPFCQEYVKGAATLPECQNRETGDVDICPVIKYDVSAFAGLSAERPPMLFVNLALEQERNRKK